MPYERKRTSKSIDDSSNRKKYWALYWFLLLVAVLTISTLVVGLTVFPNLSRTQLAKQESRLIENKENNVNRSYSSLNSSQLETGLWFVPHGLDCDLQNDHVCGQGTTSTTSSLYFVLVIKITVRFGVLSGISMANRVNF